MKIPSRYFFNSVVLSPVLALAFALLPTMTLSAQSTTKGRMSKQPMSAKSSVGLEGYCPVCIIAARKWEKGKSNIASTFDGVAYYFPNQALKKKFDQMPLDYVPVLNGDCIVCYAKHGKRVAGNIRHAAMHKGRLFMFPSEKEKAMFMNDADSYVDSDIAAKGNCIVCKVAAGKDVAGSTKHTVLHKGLRYLFPSEKEANMFRKNPGKFTSAKVSLGERNVSAPKSSAKVSVSGRSACAACEFGVSPLGATDELGLAIVGKDKRITVVEDAHKLYPQIYKDRFQGKQILAMGTVLKKQGNVTWIKPTSLTLAN